MGTLTIDIARTCGTATLWTREDVKRASRPLARCEGPKLPARNAAGQAIVAKIISHGEGVIGTRPDGSKIKTQVWADHPWAHRVWLKVYEADAKFRGEMLVGEVDRDGRITSVDTTSYTASGERE